MNSHGLAWITSKQKADIQEFILQAREAPPNQNTPPFLGENPPRRLWIYTGSGLPYNYAEDDCEFASAHARNPKPSVMQNRVMPPALPEIWLKEIAEKYDELNPTGQKVLVNYFADAAATQFERFIGVAHLEAFNNPHPSTGKPKRLLVLEPLIEPVPGPDTRKFVPLYSSLHFEKAPWWALITPGNPGSRTWQCNLIPQSDEYHYYYANGGSVEVNTHPTQCPFETTTVESKRYWMDEFSVHDMKTRGQPTSPDTGYIPIGKPGEPPWRGPGFPLPKPFYQYSGEGWFGP